MANCGNWARGFSASKKNDALPIFEIKGYLPLRELKDLIQSYRYVTVWLQIFKKSTYLATFMLFCKVWQPTTCNINDLS
jgi:hypothetical protein